MELYKSLMKNKEFMKDVFTGSTKLEFISTGIISINLAMSGRVSGGIPVGKVIQFAAASSLGKSYVALSALKNAQRSGKICVVFDTEFAFDFEWAEEIGIDISPEKLIVVQQNQIEIVQQRFMEIVDGLTLEERRSLFIVLDSYGGLVTSKTVVDATTGKDVADMTEAKKKNRFAKLLMGSKCTVFVVNHIYDNVGGFGDPVSIPGGRGLYFASSGIILGSTKAKDKESGEESGWIVSIMTKKSRFGKEGSKLKFRIKHDGGLDPFYGLLKDALEHGCVTNPSVGFYTRPCVEGDKKIREKDIYEFDFWQEIFKKTDFKKYLENKYSFKDNEQKVKGQDMIELLV